MNTKKMIYTSIFTAMTLALTMAYRIPVGTGYVHFGDSIIYLAAFLLGGAPAAFAGAVGGALADIASGYTVYALPTAIVKSLMALAAAFFYKRLSSRVLGIIAAFAVGGLIMVGGYYVSEVIIYGNISSPLLNIPMNVVQILFSVILPVILTVPLKKIMK